MKFAPQSAWLTDGPDTDVVMSCRVRLARNVAGFPFVNRASNAQRHEMLKVARQAILSAELSHDIIWVDLHQATPRDRQLLMERHLISKPLADADFPRGVAVWADETLSIMVNEEDHLRMQALAPGMQLEETFRRINAVDDAIERNLDYAYSPRWGYVTACPTNLGTGIRISVMMHLPGLRLSDEIKRVRNAARDLHLAVRGYYGEGSDSAGDFYQISNQVTLGRGEEEILNEFHSRILPQIIDYERQARQVLLRRRSTLLDDRIYRALGTLRAARLLGTEEAMKLLSRVRLGVYMNRLDGVEARTVNQLFLQIQPAHLQPAAGPAFSAEELREVRATLIREALR